jgi:hypothetical protein
MPLLARLKRAPYALARKAAKQPALREIVMRVSTRFPNSFGRIADIYRAKRSRELGVLYKPPARKSVRRVIATSGPAMPPGLSPPQAIAFRRIAAGLHAGDR